jgi:hypothetical protein
LKILQTSKIVSELSQIIEDETNLDKLMICDNNEVIMTPEIVTEITVPGMTRVPIFKLNDLFI